MRDVGKAVDMTLHLAGAARTCYDAACLAGVFVVCNTATGESWLLTALAVGAAALLGIAGVVLQWAAGRQL